MISAVVLAAAQAQLSNDPKFFLPLRGKPVLQWILESALAADLGEVVCVTHDLKTARKQIALTDKRLFWLMHYASDGHHNSSMIAGLWAINPRNDGALFLRGDQPLIRANLIDALVGRFAAGSTTIVAPSFNGEPRHPILFGRELFPELIQLRGDRTANALIEKYREQTALIECKDGNSFLGLDANENLERIQELA